MKHFVQVAMLADLDEGTAMSVDVDGAPVALFRVGDQVFAVDNYCPHAGYTLHDGYIDKTSITCLLHGAEFDITNGTWIGGASCVDIATFKVKIDDDGAIWVLSGKMAE